jgi:hypothetical protein
MRLSKAKELMSTVLWDLNETILLEGETGVGKSQLVAALAQEKNFELIDLRLGQMEVGDLIGMPMLIGNETHWARPCWWPRGDRPCLLFLDEINRGSQAMNQAVFQLILDRRLHRQVLPPETRVIAAINPEGGTYDVTRMDPAMRNRMIRIRIEVKVDDWLNWAMEAGLDDTIVDFIDSNPGMLLEAQNNNVTAFASPRAWEKAARLVAFMGRETSKWEELGELLGGIVGDVATNKYLAYLRVLSNRKVLEELLQLCPGDIEERLRSNDSEFKPVVIGDSILQLSLPEIQQVAKDPERLSRLQTILRLVSADVRTNVFCELARCSPKGPLPARANGAQILFNALVADSQLLDLLAREFLLPTFRSTEGRFPLEPPIEVPKALAQELWKHLTKVGVDPDSLGRPEYWKGLTEQTLNFIYQAWQHRENLHLQVLTIQRSHMTPRAANYFFGRLPQGSMREFLICKQPVTLGEEDWKALTDRTKARLLTNMRFYTHSLLLQRIALEAVRMALQLMGNPKYSTSESELVLQGGSNP